MVVVEVESDGGGKTVESRRGDGDSFLPLFRADKSLASSFLYCERRERVCAVLHSKGADRGQAGREREEERRAIDASLRCLPS